MSDAADNFRSRAGLVGDSPTVVLALMAPFDGRFISSSSATTGPPRCD